MVLKKLIKEAEQLLNFRQCDVGHLWLSIGGRPCPYDDINCSQLVYKCHRCGEIDYGELSGPGYVDCQEWCRLDNPPYLNADR